MGIEAESHEATTTPPKLSLSKLPSKQRQPFVMSTPPINTSASIPFQWEEAPGKPRAQFVTNYNKSCSSAARCLDLPPRLLNSSIKFTNVSCNSDSPTTVLDGPYNNNSNNDRSFSECSSTFSLPNKGTLRRSLVEEIVGEVVKCAPQTDVMNKERYHYHPSSSVMNVVGSWRWGSYKENSSSVSLGANAKPPRRLKRRSSFSSFSHASSKFLAGIYGSFKQVVPWRRRQEQKKT
ncbi:hypothetical protein ACH5RR_017253 [Cinchona calisaya]|uniref:Uncharacterized protein n=1 Tax=Cinchona calisaya TaxID=153742 RepID=A0ABD2ZZG1_9GENT